MEGLGNAIKNIGGLFQGLVFIIVMAVVGFAVADQVINQGLISNTSTFYQDFTDVINKITGIFGLSVDILKLIVVVVLLLSIVYYFATR